MSPKIEGPLRQKPSPAARDEGAGGVQGEPMGKSCLQRAEGTARHPQQPPALLLVQRGTAAGPAPGKPTPCIAAYLLLPSQLTAACAPRNSTVPPMFSDLIWGYLDVFFSLGWVGFVWFVF